VGFFLVIDRCAGGEQLRGSLFDLGHRGTHHTRFGLVVGGALNHVFQAAGDRQQQRRIVAQVLGASGIETFKVFDQPPEHRQLLFDRDVFGQHLLKTRYQPTDGSGAGAGLVRVDFGPVAFAQVVQQTEAGQQPLKGFALVQSPGQPGADAQILGLGAQQVFAVFTDFQPVNLTAFVHGRGFGQLAFQRLIFARKANILAREILFGDRGFCEFEVMSGKFA